MLTPAFPRQTPISRAARVETAESNIYNMLNKAERKFVGYVLHNYVEIGVDELDISKLSTLLTARYGSMDGAQRELGDVEQIRSTFIDFQKHLYAA